MFALLTSLALACGQTTHIWTALHAVDHLPDGPLKARLSSEAGIRALISGTMFPDGGYSPLSRHPYGEAAHWEPFQDRVLDWVAAEHAGDPEHEAFLYGLGAHGIGDQLFDAMYVYRSGEGQMDEQTDIVIASMWGRHEQNEHFVPYEELVPLFADVGITVDTATLRLGMSSLDIAVLYVGAAGENPEAVEEAAAEAPWSAAYLEDETVPGSPICLGKAIARYWQVLEQRLAGEGVDDLVLATFPEDGGYAHPQQDRDSLISVVFARGMDEASVEADGVVSLVGPDGEVPADVWLYYRQASHVLNIQPTEPLADDATYTVTVNAGPTSIGGDVLATPYTFSFSTGPAPVVDEPEEDASPEASSGCACANAGHSGAWLIGALILPWMRRRQRLTAHV